MRVYIHFDSQVRRLAGCSQISLDVDQDVTLLQIVQRVANAGKPELRSTLLDEHDSLRPSLLVFLNNELVSNDQPCVFYENAELTLTTLISGG